MIGYHIRKHDSLLSSITQAISTIEHYDLQPCGQFFLTGPFNHDEVVISQDDKAEIYELAKRYPFIVHGAYVSNPWNKARGTIHNLKKELILSDSLNCQGVIIHLSKNATDDTMLKYVLSKTKPYLSQRNKLWLEINSTKQSDTSFETPEKINKLFSRIHALKFKHVGLCIDTAHLFACNLALDSYQSAKAFFDKLTLREDQPIMFHLNDTYDHLGSGKDKHAALYKGNIWKAYKHKHHESGIYYILKYAKKHNSLVILERNQGEDESIELAMIQKMIS
jgi:endonuclease IV